MATRFDSDSDIVNKTIAEARLNAEKHQFMFFAVEAEFDNDVLRINTTAGDVIFGGNTYQGVGTLLSMSAFEDTAEMKSSGLTISLSGLDPSILSHSLTNDYHNRPITVFTGFLDGGGEHAGAVMTSFKGRMTSMQISESAEGANTITVNCENRLVDLKRPSNLRYAKESQKLIDSTDTGFNRMEKLATVEILWGKKSTNLGGLGGSNDPSNDLPNAIPVLPFRGR
tara:strand:+ start:3606 stop:4283 length:678 start_codon:yes stop_codon:yes gene_type:complete